MIAQGRGGAIVNNVVSYAGSLGMATGPPLAALVPYLVRYLTAEFAATDKWVMMTIRWLRRRSLEINLEKVESVTVSGTGRARARRCCAPWLL